jgi:hypothetical protein
MTYLTQNDTAGGMAGLPGHRVPDDDIVLVGVPEESAPTAWQWAWRLGLAPQFSAKGLQGLRKALEHDSPELITGSTCYPPPLQAVSDWPVERCCPLCLALCDGLSPAAFTVGELEERFAQACRRCDERLGEMGGVRHFLNAVDSWTRPELIRNLVPEVQQALAKRQPAAA